MAKLIQATIYPAYNMITTDMAVATSNVDKLPDLPDDRVIVDNMVEALGGEYIGARSYTLPTDKLLDLTTAISTYNSNPKLNHILNLELYNYRG